MRKWMYIVLTCVVGASTTTIKAEILPNSEVKDSVIKSDKLINEDDLGQNEDLEENDTSKDELNLEDSSVTYLTRELFNQILKEQGLEELVNNDIDTLPNQGEVAYMLCKLIGKSGVYLADEENISDPYVGRLMLLGIWQDEYTDEAIEISKWGEVYGRALTYKIDGEVIKHTKQDVETRMQEYREIINEAYPYVSIIIGEFTISNYTLSSGVYTYPLYNFKDTNYIDINTLEALGYKVTKEGENYYLNLEMESKELDQEVFNKELDITLGNEKVFLEDISSYVVKTESNIFVPIRFLEKHYNLTIQDNCIKIDKKLNQVSSDLKHTEGKIVYEGDLPIELDTVTYYWDKSKLYERTNTYSLDKGDVIEINSDSEILRKGKYINTIIKRIETEEDTINYNELYGQDVVEELLKHYEITVEKERLEKERLEKERLELEKIAQNIDLVFPPGDIIATVKYSTNGLYKGDEVELYMQGGGYYTVITDSGSKVRVSGSSLNIQPHSKVTAEEASKYQIETFINKQNISSDTSYLVWTDIYRQTTYVLKGDKSNWELIKRMPCSTGENYTPTPRGFFELNAKVPSFGQNKGYCCKNAYGFIGTTYLYHSVLFDTSGTYITSGKKELGKEKASHGCIRLSPEDSLWLYNTMPQGTKVWIN